MKANAEILKYQVLCMEWFVLWAGLTAPLLLFSTPKIPCITSGD